MNRLKKIEKEQAVLTVATLYDSVEKKLGMVPNMVKFLGNSKVALQAYLGLSGTLSGGVLRPVTREKIALLVAEYNECDYCLSAHSAIGGSLKVPAGELENARRGEAADPKEAALLMLTQSILDNRGAVTEEEYARAVSKGVTREEATELVAHVAVNLFTNYFNRFAQPEIDFPKASPLVETGSVV